MNELKFPYNLFIGQHMVNGALRVKCEDTIQELIDVDTRSWQVYFDEIREMVPLSECVPQLKDPKTITDEEWFFVFFGDDLEAKSRCFIDRDTEEDSVYARYKGVSIAHHYNVCFFDIMFEYCDQQILNRLYSLHTLPDFEYFKKNGMIEVVDGEVRK